MVTGASSGLGAEFARRLAARGYSLILVARRRDRLELIAAGTGGEVLAADLATDAGVALVEERIRGEARLEMLVNNAGFGAKGRFVETDLAAQDRMHRLHVLATMRLTRAALEGMVARNRGAIINVSSVAGFSATPGSASYCATKAWMTSFTVALDRELRGSGSAVKVEALCPGFTRTEFHETMGVDAGKIPASLWLDAGFVVAESLRALDRGQVVVVPGWRYKVLVALLRHAPHGVLRAATIMYSRKAGRA
jgi:uncharacterized protein